MDLNKFSLSFEEIVETDIPELTAVMTRAFDDDARKHLGLERSGPEGYDNGGFFRKWLFGYEETVGYKAVAQGMIVGAAIAWIFEHGKNVLGTIFVDSPYQDRGVGTSLWQFIEKTHSDTTIWRLRTPSWAIKNHYFYETKCGFHRMKAEAVAESTDDLWAYQKKMQ